MITRHTVAKKIYDYLNRDISLEQLVDWCENVLMNNEVLVEKDAEVIGEVVARIGVADVKNFGLLWEDCDNLLHKLGYRLDIELSKVA